MIGESKCASFYIEEKQPLASLINDSDDETGIQVCIGNETTFRQ